MILLLILPLLILLLKCLKQSNFLQFVEYFSIRTVPALFIKNVRSSSIHLGWRPPHDQYIEIQMYEVCTEHCLHCTRVNCVIIIMYEICTEHCFHCIIIITCRSARRCPLNFKKTLFVQFIEINLDLNFLNCLT